MYVCHFSHNYGVVEQLQVELRMNSLTWNGANWAEVFGVETAHVSYP